MVRGLDHVVHAVRDLDAAAMLYRSLGFQVLAVADPTEIAPHGPRFFSFGAFNRDAIARGDGPSMLVLESHDARADAVAFRGGGIGDFEPFDFEREGRRPDGNTIKVAFSLAFAQDPRADIGFFACQQHYPENFWNPVFQSHFNTAAAIAGVVIVAAQPADHYRFLTAFTGQKEVIARPGGLTFETPRGEVQVVTPPAFERMFGEAPPDTAKGARLAALRFAVRSLGAAASLLAGSRLAVGEHGGRLIVGPQQGLGAMLVFEPVQTL